MRDSLTDHDETYVSFWLPQPKRTRMNEWKAALIVGSIVFVVLLALGLAGWAVFVREPSILGF